MCILLLTVAVFAMFTIMAYADEPTVSVFYVGPDGSSSYAEAECMPVTSGNTEWEDGWYAVTENVTLGNRVEVEGEVNLILCDGAVLEATKGINVRKGQKLVIWAQSTDKHTAGTLNAVAQDCAGIGSENYEDAGTIIINGGNISAKSTRDGAGIGTGKGNSQNIYEVKEIIINGGYVYAEGEGAAAGIGSGGFNKSNTITINGGVVVAKGGVALVYGGCAIGASRVAPAYQSPDGGKININGGDITAIAFECAIGSTGDATIKIDPEMCIMKPEGGAVSSDKNCILDADGNVADYVRIKVPERQTIVTDSETAGGSIFCTRESMMEFQPVTLTCDPDTGYRTKSVIVTDEDGVEVTVNDEGNDTYTFEMPTSTAYATAEFELIPKADFWPGSGTVDDPYIISSDSDWENLQQNPEYYPCAFMADSDFTAGVTVGDEEHPFSGVFDGNGNTMTLGSGLCPAPFGCTAGNHAEIRNLRITGTVHTDEQFAAGIVSQNAENGRLTIENCLSSVTIDSTVDGDGTHGGLVGANFGKVVFITGCAFNGKLLGDRTYAWGGFVGYSRETVSVADSFFVPQQITASSEISATLARIRENFFLDDSNVCCTDYFGVQQGTRAYPITVDQRGSDIGVEFSGKERAYDVSGISVYDNDCIEFDGVYYGVPDRNVTFTIDLQGINRFNGLTYTVGDDAEEIDLMGTDAEGVYTIPMTDKEVVIHTDAMFDPFRITVEPCEHGTAAVDNETYEPGDYIRLNVTPDEGYELEGLTVTDSNHDSIGIDEDFGFTMPASDVTVTAKFMYAIPSQTVSYVDMDGNDASRTMKILTGNETRRISDDGNIETLVLGTGGQESWYAVLDDLTYGGGGKTVNLELTGRVNIVVADGKTLTVNDSIRKHMHPDDHLDEFYLYGQSGQDGAATVGSIDQMDFIAVCGGDLSIGNVDLLADEPGAYVDIYRGTLAADTIRSERIRVYGGVMTADTVNTNHAFNGGGTLNAGNLTASQTIEFLSGVTNISGRVESHVMELGCEDMSARITIGEYGFDDPYSTLKVYPGQTLTDGVRTYSGTLSHDGEGSDADQMAGRTLMRVREPGMLPAFKSQALVLSGKIGLIFYMDLRALSEDECNDSYMTFDIKQHNCTERADFDVKHMNSAKEYFGFTCYVNAIQMAEPITATFHYQQDDEWKTVEFICAVSDYFEGFDRAVSEGEITDETTIALVKSVADYGHYVQPFLAAERHWTIGSDYEEMDVFYETSYDIDAVKNAVSSQVVEVDNQSEGDIKSLTSALVLDSETAFKVSFKPGEGYTGKLKASVDGGKKVTYSLSSGGKYIIKIKNISAHKLSERHSIEASTVDGHTVTVTASPLSYVGLMMDYYSDNDEALRAGAAIYAYSKAADDYKAAHLNE